MSKKILIVDDDPTLTCLLKSYLTDNGFEVFSAVNGDEGLKKLESERPDLILLDVVMPKVNGYSFLFLMRKLEGIDIPPVIVLTCKAELSDIFKAEGVCEYMLKPFSNKDLLDKIKQYI